MSGSFADSNVLLYLLSNDTRKADIAQRLLDTDLVISVQVLNEIASVTVGKWRRPISQAAEILATIRGQVRVVPLDEDTHDLGMTIAARHRLSIYDSMIVAAALLAGCDRLYTEDMQAGLVVEDRLRLIDPFAA